MATTALFEFSSLIESIPNQCFIGGNWRDAVDGATFSVFNPADEERITGVADASIADALLGLDAAHGALAGWAAVSPRQRGETLRRGHELMIERREMLAQCIVGENGKTLSDARAEVTYAAEFFRWFGEEAVRNYGAIYTAPSGENRVILLHQPIGVALLITPWNFPAAMLTRKLAPALAAGCSVICKPAEDTPLTALLIAALLEEAGTPPGVVNVVPTSKPAELVSALIKDPRVRKVSFTGSTEVGRVLLRQAAEGIVSCSMELGGNAPFIIFSDCDLDAVVKAAMTAKMRNAGQVCTAANRFYVERSVAGQFAERFSQAMGALRVGSGFDPVTEVGPLINKAAQEKVTDIVQQAQGAGADVLVGGKTFGDRGYFFSPTVLANVSPDAAILNEEIFGPVAPVVSFDGEDEVIAEANHTTKGLVSYVFTEDLARALRVAESLEAGMIGLNRALVSDPAAPFGGVKESGIGREGGPGGMSEFLETKYIASRF